MTTTAAILAWDISFPLVLAWAGPGLVVVALVWVTVAGRDAWPFSHYPMFSAYRDEKVVRFFRLQFRLPGDQVVPPPPGAGLLADDFDRAFAAVWPGDKAAALLRDHLALAVRLNPALREARKIEVVLRVAQLGRDRGVSVAENTVLTIDCADGARGSPGT